MAMTKEQLAEIRGRVEKATGGPWIINKTDDAGWCECPLCQNEGEVLIENITGDGWKYMIQSCGIGEMVNNNSDFIAHVRQDVPELLDEVERLQSQLQATKEALDMYIDDIVPTLRKRLEDLHIA